MSTQRRIYLDFNATAPLLDAARTAMTEAMAETGNPSSVHAEGRRARDRVETARRQVAALVGRPREQIVFTSGGTEANWLGVHALAKVAEARGLPKVVVTTGLEHPSLRGAVDALAGRGWTVRVVGVSDDAAIAVVDRCALPDSLEPDRVGLVALAGVNHELGTVLAPHVVSWARSAGALVHVDAVQAAGKVPLATLDADSVAISAHKLGGPQGTGALAISVDEGLPFVAGGHQERGRRPGTENVLGIVGFGAAAAAADPADWPRVTALGDRLATGLCAIERVSITARRANHVGGTINAGFAGALGESIVMALDLEGIAVSTGAACTSGSSEPSPVLLALGLSRDEARSAVRFSLGRTTTDAEIDEVLRVLPGIVDRARRFRG